MSISNSRFIMAATLTLPMLLGGCVVASAPYYDEGYAAPPARVYTAPAPAVVYTSGPYVVHRNHGGYYNGNHGRWNHGRW